MGDTYYIKELEDFYISKWKRFNQMEQRLAKEHLLMEEYSIVHSNVHIEPLDEDELPPTAYKVKFKKLKSIVGIGEDESPRYGYDHVMEIKIPLGYPINPAICYITTDIWHPNIQCEEGPFKGRICGNTEGFGAHFSLDELIDRVRDILSYKIYHAEYTYPYPEDETVARWVKKYAEPRGIVSKGVGLIDLRDRAAYRKISARNSG